MPSYSNDDAYQLRPISESDWKGELSGLLGRTNVETYRSILHSATGFTKEGRRMLNSGQRRAGLRSALKGIVLSHMASEFSKLPSPTLSDSIELGTSERLANEKGLREAKKAFVSIGLTEENFETSLGNAAMVAGLDRLAEKFLEKARLRGVSPESKKPQIHSRDALDNFLKEAVENGTSISEFWCEESKILQTNLFSPRSYRIYGTKSRDLYHSGSYGNSYRVLIESSNQGGSPIAVTWGISLAYSELIHKKGSLGWCISYIRN